MIAVEGSDGKAGVSMYRAAANAPRILTPNESSAATVRRGCQFGHAFDWAFLRPLGSADRCINTDVAVGCGDGVRGRQSVRGWGKTSRLSCSASARQPRRSAIPLVDAFLT
jgi:hypothetical protein